MKKAAVFILSFIILFIFSSGSYAEDLNLTYDGIVHKYTGQVFSLKIDGKTVNSDVPPVIINKVCYIPVRAAFEKLGAVLKWDSASRKMTVTYNGMKLVFKDSNKYVKINSEMQKMDALAKLVNARLMVPLSFFEKQLGMVASISNESLLVSIDNRNILKEVKYSRQDGKDRISLFLNKYKGYNIMRLTGPDRIVIDIPGTYVPDKLKKVDTGSGIIKSVRYAQFDNNTARVVLDITGQHGYKTEEAEGQLSIFIETPTYRNIRYYNNNDRRGFILNGARLTDGTEFLTKFYSESYDPSGRKYTITFSGDLADIDSGLIEINDELLNSVKVLNDKNNNTKTIIFNAKDKLAYQIITRPESGDTAITVLKPAMPGEKLIVIDPGHGGKETGAVYGDIYEKNLNLDIALKLNALLKAKNIKTYMLREDDSFVGLYERGYISNSLNAALFLSIHNNAMDDPGYGGTMTLYYPQNYGGKGFNGKRFAAIIQEMLLKKLNTIDRKIIERPNLIVLKSSIMPAALAEVAFMTNKNDRRNLLTESFRQKAAQALCDAVVKSIEELGNS